MRFEQLIHERAQPLPGQGAACFVTALTVDFPRARVIRESHVFLPEEGRHLHEIVFLSARAGCSEETLVEDARAATRELFARHLAERAANLRWRPAAVSQALVLRRLESHPFHDLLLAGKFREELWQIQDWTTSAELRAELAKLTAYRCDFGEAELLARIFSAGARGAQPAA